MWQWVKAAKGVALVAFFLPWMTVSCTSTELLHASGWDLAMGKPKLTPQLAQLAGQQMTDSGAHPSVWLLLALAAIAIGLILAFRSARSGALAVIATSVAALLLVWIGTQRLGSEGLTQAAARSGGGLDAALALQIRIDWKIGFWLCLLALAAAAVLAGMSMARRGSTAP